MKLFRNLLTALMVSFCYALCAWADDNYFDVIAKHALNGDTEMTLTGDGWTIGHPYNSGQDAIYQYIDKNATAELYGTVTLTTPSVLCFTMYGSNSCIDTELYVDGDLVRSYSAAMNDQTYYSGGYYYSLSTGSHSIVWKFTHNGRFQSSQPIELQQIGIVSTPQISVELLEPGSLGTEVLNKVDHVNDVRSLKIKGRMNANDWTIIYMMTELMALDLSDVEMSSLPDNALGYFSNSNHYTRMEYLNSLKLPLQLQSIGQYALCASRIEDIEIPSTVTSIGRNAFACSFIREANVENVAEIPEFMCYECPLLEDITLSDNLVSVGEWAFNGCFSIKSQTIQLPSTITDVGYAGFKDCEKLNFRFPETEFSLGIDAFKNTAIDQLIVKKKWDVKFGDFLSPIDALPQCVYMEFPVQVNDCNLGNYSNSYSFPMLNRLKLKCPTVCGHGSNSYFDLSGVTLEVPSFLVNSYKLDPYWYNANAIVGFSTSEIDYWYIANPLTLNASDRFEGNPTLEIATGGALKINGEAPMTIDDLILNVTDVDHHYGQLYSNCNQISASGDLSLKYNTSEKRWYFISLPFDMKVSEIEAGDAQYAIRYYDGANRATVGATGSWKNYDEDDIIPAGTGFIYQTNKDAWTTFHADPEGENKQQIFSTSEFSKSLELHTSETLANKGWNLIGNPYQCYYNNHMLNFTAPITVWDVWNRTYTAYSLTDDDYAIRPNEAFFVQCPGTEVQTISFPTQGKQLTNVIESQNAAKMRDGKEISTRQLIDLEVRNGEVTDKTRVVMNEEASLDYDMDCDASKFMSTEAPQIYTIGEDGTAYAINERPVDEGDIQLGFYAEKQGSFTISMPRCQAKKVYLVDEVENLTIDLTAQDYGFTASKGKQETRFRLVIESDEATDIKDVENESDEASEEGAIYNLNGQLVGDDYKGVVIKDGKKVYMK